MKLFISHCSVSFFSHINFWIQHHFKQLFFTDDVIVILWVRKITSSINYHKIQMNKIKKCHLIFLQDLLIGSCQVWFRYSVMFYNLPKPIHLFFLSSSVQLFVTAVFKAFPLSVPANQLPSCLGKSVSHIPAAFAGHRASALLAVSRVQLVPGTSWCSCGNACWKHGTFG